MKRFFFHLVWPDGREEDALGSEFDGLEAAYLDASRAVLDMTSELAMEGRNPLAHLFEVCDDNGQVLLELPFAEILRAPAPRGMAANLAERLRRANELYQRHRRLNAALQTSVNEAMSTVREIRSRLNEL